jgi:hypothetical protein
MSARRLGRFARLVLVLVAIVAGGVGAAELGVQHSGAAASTHSAIQAPSSEVIWT